ncbi:MAG: glutamine synthetase family protein [candidate division WOR-3 bacterium]|nr:glutamine synthetase family protein [candidate division WOR-3 bacterium]MCX7837680.1 glutamine synthetase family protein [candidate division WOR-3 bacterium]MDW8113411.1 glutamine synthetase beta-grasp domain-containing protein [candidate division WOR-3 bacterium]
MDLEKFVKENNIEFVDLKYVDLIGKLHHLTLPIEKFNLLKEKGIGFDGSSVFGFVSNEESDLTLFPDLSQYYIDIFYQHKTLSLFAHVFLKNQPYQKDPRLILKKAVELFKKEIGIDKILFRTELEFYLLEEADFNFNRLNGYYHFFSEEKKEKNIKLPYEKSYQESPPFDKYYEFRQEILIKAKELGIDIKYHHHENGQFGQEEVETEFYEPIRICDNILILKYLIRNLAKRHNKIITFIPKLFYDEPGNGLHFHFQILRNGKNILFSKETNLSEEGKYFINGIFAHLKSISAFANPSSNSYRRLLSGFEAPSVLDIGLGNRNTIFRIPLYLEEDDLAIEFRLPDALCNPYLLLSSFLLAGLDGIKKKIEFKENFDFPKNLKESLIALKEDNQFLLKNNIFNKEIIEEWIKIKEQELKLINEFPHPLEYLLYFNL